MRNPTGADIGSSGDARRYWEWRCIVWMVVVEMHGVARRVGGGMWVAAKFDCPTNRLEAWLAKETLRAAIFISLTRLRIQLENLYASSLHNLPDHNHQGLQ